MQQKKNGLSDSDKVFITVALWISAIAVFATILTLPMLPDDVLIFYHPTENEAADSYSKFNNLYLIIGSIVPAFIVLVTAVLKKRNRLQNNFASIMLFGIILSLCLASITIYGITRQFDSSSTVQFINWHAIVALILSFFMSMLFAILPSVINSAEHTPKSDTAVMKCVYANIRERWNVGAYGFLLCGIACTFTPDAYCYIPLAACVAAHTLFILIYGKKRASDNAAADGE